MSAFHSSLDLLSSLLCLWMGAMAWRRYRSLESGFLLFLAISFVVAGVSDAVHGFVALTMAESDPYALPLTWSFSRGFLGLGLLVACLTSGRKIAVTMGRWFMALCVVGSLILMRPYAWAGLEIAYGPGMDHIHRPLDFALAILWGVLFVLFRFVPLARLQAPRMFWLFLLIGFYTHLMMALGSNYLWDGACIAAHVWKVLEYLVWCLLEYFEERQIQRDGIEAKSREMFSNSQETEDILESLDKLRSRAGDRPDASTE